MVINMTVMVRPWDVEDAMELHSLSMHPYYVKQRVWKYLYPDTFLNAVSTIHFYQSADPQRYLFRAVEKDGKVCGFLECEKKTSSSAELSYWLGVEFWHQGIMQKAVHDLCVEAFDQLQLLSIYALVEKRIQHRCMCWKQTAFKEKNSESCICLKNINKRLENIIVLYFFGMDERFCK